MGRQNYMTIAVTDSVQEMFDEFVKRKNLTKTAALSDMVEMYMLAKDEGLYLELKKKYLGVDIMRDLLADRDAPDMDADYLFMKLRAYQEDDGASGQEVMETYMTDEQRKGYTWFSTESLFFGMKESRVKEYNEKIRNGETVRILFAINNEESDNDIEYSAQVMRIYSAKLPVACPEENGEPEEWRGETARIWVQMRGLKRESAIRASMLKITSTGRDLKEAISNSQYHFGYVSFK